VPVCAPGQTTNCPTETLVITVPVNTLTNDAQTAYVNIPTSGNISTNDVVPAGTTYGQPAQITGATITVNANGTYSFTATTAGTYTYTVPVCAPGQTTNCPTEILVITVPNPTTAIITPDLNVTNINVPVKGNLSTNDKITTGTTYGTPIASTTNPAGGTITVNKDGTYTFTGNTPGKYIYYVPVCAAGQVTRCPLAPLEITVLDPATYTDKPVANNDIATIKYNSPTTINILANDNAGNPGSSLNPSSVSVAVQPANGTVVVNADGTITYTPASGYVGTDSVIYTICDNTTPAKCNDAVVYFTIQAELIPAITTAVDDYNTIPGSVNGSNTVSGNVLSNDINTGTLTSTNALVASLVTGPSSAQGILVFNSDGTYNFTPAAGFSGPVDIVYEVCGGTPVTCAKATLHILVDPVPVVLKPDFNETLVNIPVTGNVSTNDEVIPGTNYGPPQAAASNPSGANFKMNTDGSYTFNSNVPGTYIYYVPVCNPGQTTGCPIVPIQITVIDPNIKTNPPIGNPDVETTLVNTPVKTSVLLNDRATNIGAVLNIGSLVISKNPANGKAVTNPDGTITYTPAPGFVGTDSLIYSICDNSIPANCKNAVVYYTIKPAGLSPLTIASDDYVSTYQKTAYGNLLINDKNTGANNNLTISSYNKPLASQGVLVINPDGTYSFIPALGFVGPIDIIYTVCGGTPKTCANATLHILVKPLIPTQIFDIRKSASGIKLNMDGSFNISFNILIKNLTNESIDSVSIKDDLTKVFTDINGIKVLGVTSSGLLVNNNSYDGIANIELLNIISTLNAYKTDSINILVNVGNNNSGNFQNTAILKAPMSIGIVDLASTDPARLSSDSTKRIPTLFVIPKIDFKIPEGFSPNNDGIDDTWNIIKPFGSKVAVKVFNRWGNEVFRSDDYKNDWRGKGVANFLGEDVPEGTYYYIVEGTDFNGGVVRLAGPLTIKR
jgi:gliding motility-associated-like protein